MVGNNGNSERRIAQEAHLRSLERRLEAVEAGLEANTKLTNVVKANTDAIVEFFEAGRGLFVVVRWTGLLAKWVTTIAAAMALAWGMFKFGLHEAWRELWPK